MVRTIISESLRNVRREVNPLELILEGFFLIFAERNVVVLTQLQVSFKTTGDERRRDAYESLDAHEKVMYDELELDIKQARAAVRTFFGSSKLVNGDYCYVLLRRKCQFAREFKDGKRYVSNLVLDDADSLTYEVFVKLIGILKLAEDGYRLIEPEHHIQCETYGIDYAYFTYNIDFS